MTDWRKIKTQDPGGAIGFLLVPPDDNFQPIGPLWHDECVADHVIYCLNIVKNMDEVGLSIPVPEPEHFDIVFTPARKRVNSPRRAQK